MKKIKSGYQYRTKKELQDLCSWGKIPFEPTDTRSKLIDRLNAHYELIRLTATVASGMEC